MDNIHFRRGVFHHRGEFSDDLIELAKGKGLEISPLWFNRNYKSVYSECPYKGVVLAHPTDTIPDEYRFIAGPSEYFKPKPADLAMTIRSSLEKYFTEIIRPGERYLVFHSAGFDSRIISLVLMSLRENIDTSQIHFRCHQPEEPMFLKIMERQGWPKDQYSVYEGPDEDYYDIGRPDRPLNGWQNYNQQMNFWSDLGEDWNLITGVGGELFKFMALSNPKWKPARTNNENFNLLLNQYPFEGQWEGYWRRVFKESYLPFFSYHYLSVSLLNRPPVWFVKGVSDTMRREVVRSFIGTHNVDCLNIEYCHHNYSWSLSDKRKKLIDEWFYSSKLYRDYKKHIPENLDFHSDKILSHPTSCFEASLWGFATVYEQTN